MGPKNRFEEQAQAIQETQRRVEQARDEVYPVVPVDGTTWRLETEDNPFEAAGEDAVHRVKLADLPRKEGLANVFVGEKLVQVPLYFGFGATDYVAAADLAPHLDALQAPEAEEVDSAEAAGKL